MEQYVGLDVSLVDLPPERGGVGSEHHAAIAMATLLIMFTRASAGVRYPTPE